jgi:lysophospholipase L1-like esterase
MHVSTTRTLRVLAVLATMSMSACGSRPTIPTAPSAPPPVVEQPAPPPAVPPAPVLKATSFVGFGDSQTEGKITNSLTWSLTIGAPESYTFKLQALLADRYTTQTFTVWNAGFGGETTVDALPRLRIVLGEVHPDVLMLMEGANDLNGLSSASGLPAVISAVRQMIREARSQVTAVIVATIPGEMPGRSRSQGAPYVAAYNDALKQMALGEGVPIADVYAGFDAATLQGPDGLHPSNAGYTRIAQIFFDAIQASLEVPTTTMATHLQ